MSVIFHAPAFSDRPQAVSAAEFSHSAENDASFVNLFLLRRKYGTEIAFFNGQMLRKYHAGIRKNCYGFPLGNGNLREAVSMLYHDACSSGIPFQFALLTKAQCDLLEQEFPSGFSFQSVDNYTEYLYTRNNLAELKGSKNHGKRNHISQFRRSFPQAKVLSISAKNADLAVEVAEKWLAGRPVSDAPSLLDELSCIREAAENWNALSLSGMLLFAEPEQKPIGMTVFSEISTGIADVHFEKIVPGYPHAWPVIVNEMAKSQASTEYINREEDLGESGMRVSKSSYHPDWMNEKYNALWCGKELT